jgi:hypothetical protein
LTHDLAATALAAMLTLVQPGNQPGSRISVESCVAADDDCTAAGFRFTRARWDEPSREETADEGLERWAVISVAAARVAESPPREWRWGGYVGALQAVRAEITIARHESGFWRSVHEGRLRGAAGEVCLTQIHPATARALGIELDSLVGVDLEATERCFRASLIVLGNAREVAERDRSAACLDRMRYHWFQGAIAVYGSGRGCVPSSNDWQLGVMGRLRTYERTGSRQPLDAAALAALGLARTMGAL